jgi:hypothetical protein
MRLCCKKPLMPEPRPSKTRLKRLQRRIQACARRYLPPGLRLLVGVLFMLGGVFGFLPILGFWMIPLGAAIAALDVMPIIRWFRGRR